MWYGVVIVVELMCALHVYKTGRNRLWIMAILIFSLLGCTAYFAFELMPEFFGPDSPRMRQRRAHTAANPVGLLRDAEARLEQVDTAANQLAMADALFALGTINDAVRHYRLALDRTNGRDAKIEAKLAAALFEAGQFDEVLAIIDKQDMPFAQGEADRRLYLRARTLAELGRGNEAAEIYEDIVTRLPGQEARCRYAALLLETGDKQAALPVLEAAVKGAKRLPAPEREANAGMFDWADQQLRALLANEEGSTTLTPTERPS